MSMSGMEAFSSATTILLGKHWTAAFPGKHIPKNILALAKNGTSPFYPGLAWSFAFKMVIRIVFGVVNQSRRWEEVLYMPKSLSMLKCLSGSQVMEGYLNSRIQRLCVINAAVPVIPSNRIQKVELFV